MNRTFDFYEYAGIIVPGAVLILGFLWLFPESRAFFSKEGVTFGELGLFLLVAYAAGQLVQGFGNVIERVLWRFFGGLPSTRLLITGAYVSPKQYQSILNALRSDFGIALKDLVVESSSKAQLTVVRQIYAKVSAAKRAARLDTFVGNYGLNRGLAAALIVTSVFAVVQGKGAATLIALIVLTVLALQRMHRFGRHYAVELFVQYLGCKMKAR